jgi:tetratricopeptide (TPR) repeat protein
MKNKKYLWSIVVAVALGSAILVACGGGEPATPTPVPPTPVPPTPTPAATPTPSANEHVALGTEYYEQGKLDEAVAEFQAAIELEPDNADAYRNLGTAYLEQGKDEEAAAAYEQAIELDPDFGEAYGDLAGVYVDLGRLSEAIAIGEKAIELAPDYAMAYNNLGFAYYQQGMLDEAIAEYKEAIRINPDFVKARDNLGVAYMMQGRLDEAIAKFQECIRINPDHVGGHVNLGLVYYKQDKFDEAIAEYKEAIRINPDFAMVHKNLGLVYADLGQADEAIAELETYLLLQPDAPDRAAVEEWIAKHKGPAVELAAEYRNPVGGYSLRYPEGWYYDEAGTAVKFAESQAAIQVPTKDAIREVSVVIFNAGPLAEVAESLSVEEITNPTEFLQAIAEDIEMETGKIATFEIAGGYPVAAAEIFGTYEGTPCRGGLALVLVEERVVYGVALAPPDNQWEALQPTFNAMLGSLFFFEP